MKLKIWQVHHPHLQICPQLLSWSGETIGHSEMKVEGKAPKRTQTHLGYLSFPQSVLGMNKSPEKKAEINWVRKMLCKASSNSPQGSEEAIGEKKRAEHWLLKQIVCTFKRVPGKGKWQKKRVLPLWGLPACPHSPSVPAWPLCNFCFRSASSSVLEWHPLDWRRNTPFLKDSSDTFHMPYTVGKWILYHFQLDISMCVNFRLLDDNQTRVM